MTYIYICKYTTIFPKILLLSFSLLGTLFIPTMKLLSLNVTAVNTTPFSQHYSVWVSPKLKTNHTLYFSHVLWDHFRSLWGQEAGSALIALLVCYSLDVFKIRCSSGHNKKRWKRLISRYMCLGMTILWTSSCLHMYNIAKAVFRGKFWCSKSAGVVLS